MEEKTNTVRREVKKNKNNTVWQMNWRTNVEETRETVVVYKWTEVRRNVKKQEWPMLTSIWTPVSFLRNDYVITEISLVQNWTQIENFL